MNSKNLRGLREAYSGVYASPELTEEQVWEEVESWVSSLIEEGYDLSDYTWEEMFEEYLNEAGKWVDVPGKGRRFVTSSGEVRMGDPNAPLAGAARAVKQFLTKPRLTPTQMRASTSGAPAPQAGATSRPTAATSTPKPATPAKPTTPLARPPAPILPPSSATASRLAPRATTALTTTSPRPTKPAPTATPAKPSGPPVGTTAGGTKYQIRTPTSAEMAAARAAGGGEAGVRAAVARSQPTTGASSASINKQDVASSKSTFTPRDMNKNPLKASFEWGSTSKLVDGIANAYSSIYEAKKVDQDKDGDNDFADVRIARLIASGVSKEEAIRRVKDKSYNEEVDFVNEKYMGFKALKASIAAKGGVRDPGAVAASIGRKKYGKEKFQKAAATDHKLGEDFELWVNELVEEGYDLSDYTWEEMFEIYEETQLDEATRMRKELGKEGETATRKELARRSNAYQRSGSVDRTIAGAERAAGRTTPRNRDESQGDYKTRMQKRSQTLNKLAANRRGSVRSGEGLRGYASKVTGGDKDLQSARSSARSAGTLTPAEKRRLGEDLELWVNELVEEGYDLSDYTWDEMAEIYEETAKEKEERIAARRARLKEIEAQGRVMTSSKRTSQTAAQRRAEKKAEALERAAEAILNQTRGPGRVSDKPMGSQAPAAKEAPPEANRRLKTGLKRDTLGTAADDALKSR